MSVRALPSLALVALSSLAIFVFSGAGPGEAEAQEGPRIRPPMPRPPRPPPPEERRAPRFEISLTDAAREPLPAFFHAGRRFVMGAKGQRYRVRLSNPTNERAEAVVSIDGLDAIDGKQASTEKRGYVLQPFGDMTIDGFRTSMSEVATFRFSSVRDSYAGRKGDDRNVGVIGVAFFAERRVEPLERERPEASRGAAPGGAPRSRPPSDAQPGLGTEFGERRGSDVRETSFTRASSRPTSMITLRYDDREGLIDAGVPVDGDRRRDRARPFPDDRFATPP